MRRVISDSERRKAIALAAAAAIVLTVLFLRFCTYKNPDISQLVRKDTVEVARVDTLLAYLNVPTTVVKTKWDTVYLDTSSGKPCIDSAFLDKDTTIVRTVGTDSLQFQDSLHITLRARLYANSKDSSAILMSVSQSPIPYERLVITKERLITETYQQPASDLEKILWGGGGVLLGFFIGGLAQ